MQVNLTQLRSHLYEWIDQLILTGEPIEIERKGTTIKIIIADTASKKKKKFVKRKNVYQGKAEDLVHTDWSIEWSENNALS